MLDQIVDQKEMEKIKLASGMKPYINKLIKSHTGDIGQGSPSSSNNSTKWNFSCILGNSKISRLILSMIEDMNITMVVLGTKSTGQLYGAPVEIDRNIGSCAREVLYNSKVPVLICPAKVNLN